MRTITAEQLAALLLEKNLLKVSFSTEREDTSPEHMEKHFGYTSGFAAAVRTVMKHNRQWGWCTVNCTARIGALEATDYLGGCSYMSKEDFIQNSGYADDMKRTVAIDIAKQLLPIIETVSPLLGLANA